MDRLPDTTQPDHPQIQYDLATRSRPRPPRALEPLRENNLASDRIRSGSQSSIVGIARHTPDQVQVSNVKRGVTDVKWEADTPKGAYNCSADDMVRRPYCSKK